MPISNEQFCQILREEATNSFTTQNISNFKLAKNEISKFQEVDRISIYEQLMAAGQIKLTLLKSSGRKILIEILKGIKSFTGIGDMMINKIHVPVINKAIKFTEKRVGVNIPFSGEDFGKFILFFMPYHWITLGIAELIELLEDTSDTEFKSVINDISKDDGETETSAVNNNDYERENVAESMSRSRNRKLRIIVGR